MTMKVRKSLWMSQSDFALLVGVHYMTVSKWERNVLSPSPWMKELIECIDDSPKTTKNISRSLLYKIGPVKTLVMLLQRTGY